MKKFKRITAILLLAVIMLASFSCCNTSSDPYMPLPIITEAVYTASTLKGISFIEYPYCTVYTPSSLEGLYIKIEDDGSFSATLNGVAYTTEELEYLKDLDAYKVLKIFSELKGNHFYFISETDGSYKYHIEVDSGYLYVYTDVNGKLTRIYNKDTKLDIDLEELVIEE